MPKCCITFNGILLKREAGAFFFVENEEKVVAIKLDIKKLPRHKK